jgi:hypothetical protein
MAGRSIYRDTVTITPMTGSSAYAPVYGAPVNYQCYAEQGFRQIVNAEGKEVTASLMTILKQEAAGHVGVGDKGVYEGTEYAVLVVQPVKVRGHVDHVEVFLGPPGVSG